MPVYMQKVFEILQPIPLMHNVSEEVSSVGRDINVMYVGQLIGPLVEKSPNEDIYSTI